MSVPAFDQWKRQLAADTAGPADPPALLPVRVAMLSPPAIELARPGGAVLRFPAGVEFAMILDGIDLSRVRRFKRFAPPTAG